MPAEIIDGTRIAQEIRSELQGEIEALKGQGVVPNLKVILVGEDPGSVVYVRMKTRACGEMGLDSETLRLPATVSEEELLDFVRGFNADPGVHGILVQLPLPDHISERDVLHAVDAEKDVDGFHPVNRGKLVIGEDTLAPATPAGIQQLMIRSGHSPEGRRVVVLGRSLLVGMPLAIMLMQKKPGADATVTVCHSRTRDLAGVLRGAEILVAAIGKPAFVTGDMVSEGVVVIDVGVNRVDDPGSEKGYRLVGDVDFDGVAAKAAAITPVPGGVGPMTIAMLLHNTVKAARMQTRQ
jgi:methylenetetrahydrofolate dehydrogenase (NADP+)/methenyltetrahydrofolate cyclohydrolase